MKLDLNQIVNIFTTNLPLFRFVPMKRVEISVEEENSKEIEEILRKEQLTYSKFSSYSELGKIDFYSTTVADEFLDSTMEKLSSAMDLRKSDNQIIVLDVLAYVSTKLRNMQKKGSETAVKNPVEVIMQPLEQYLRITRHGMLMIILSTLVVLAGLFLDNVPIIIGSMLLSPLLGPISASIVNGSMGRTKQLVKAESSLFSMIFVSIAISAAASFILMRLIPISLGQQFIESSSPPVLQAAVAIVLGIASGLALTTKLPETLVGVAIAAALLPPLGVAGIYLGMGVFTNFLNAFVLTMIYLFGLKVGGIVYLKLSGITPRKTYEKQKARRYSIISLAVFSIILVVLVLFPFY